MKYKSTSDKELWERCRQYDDQKAFSEIFRRHTPQMLRIASRYVKDKMVAEELVMDCFFNLWDKRERTVINGKFLNYLSRCVYHSVIYYLRKEIPATVSLEVVGKIQQTDHATTDSYLLIADIRYIYNKALEKLSPRRREAFVLSRYESLTYPEIAKKMNLSIGAVEHYMVAALEGLRTNMKEYISVLILLIASIH
ncbi:RNA polymerase sigma factor [Dysgonomonas termitidis]|uniref:RNA polymerase sigma factor n=1 Tax=Dysgonomonas termitidis TaxID=1516126 RepID=A0ABV9KTX8_9BACT